MRTIKTQGLIIQKRTLGEKDYSLMLFTPEFGKLQVHAKGARRVKSKFTGHLDLLNICDVELYKSPRNYIISECQLLKNYARFRENLIKFYISEEMVKLIRAYTTENENNEEIYQLILETFEALENHNKETLILEAFKLKLFLIMGIMPDTSDAELKHLEARTKKLIKFLLTQPYSEINKLYTTKRDERLLADATRLISEQM